MAAHKEDLQTALDNYEDELREYVINNQKLAFDTSTEPQQGLGKQSEVGISIEPANLPDFGLSVIPLTLKNYS